jgi:hypothetical protein
MRALLVLMTAFTLAACGIPDTGCPASQPAAGASCTSIQSCPYADDGGMITCHCVIAMGSTDGTWQCTH